MAALTPSHILIFGSTGTIGRYITRAILAAKPNFPRVSIFSSPSSRSSQSKAALLDEYKSAGASIITGDITSEADVAAAYKDVDTVVSAVGRGALETQLLLLRIAEHGEGSSVRWFFPSEFGTDVEYDASSKDEKPHRLKLEVRRYVRDEVKRVKVTYVVTGPFAEMWLESGAEIRAGGFDVERKRAVLLGDGNGRVGLVTMPDVGKFVVGALRHPEVAAGKALKVSSFTTTPNEVLAEVKKQTSDDWEVSYTPLDELKNLEVQAWERGAPFAPIITLRRIWTEGKTLYDKLDNEALGVGASETESLETAVERHVTGKTY